jgi:hypothetical protein
MNLKPLLMLCCAAALFSSCAKVYSPALFHQDIAYQPKPTSFDTAKSLTYASAGLNVNTQNNLSDGLFSAQFNVSEGHAFKNFNLAYGAFGVLGDYENGRLDDNDPNHFTHKFFGDVGARMSANAFVTEGRADIRFIGVEMAYSHEFGSYAGFRKNVLDQSGFYVDPRTDLFTVGLTTEVIFHNKDDNGFQHGIRGFLGTTLGHNDLDGTYYRTNEGTESPFRKVFPKASYFITFKKYFGTFEIGGGIFARFGLKF